MGPSSQTGFAEIYQECDCVLVHGVVATEEVAVDAFRSSVCARLDSWEKQLSSPCNSTSKGNVQKIELSVFCEWIADNTTASTSASQQVPRLQCKVGIASTSCDQSKSEVVGSQFSPAIGNRSSRSGGLPS